MTHAIMSPARESGMTHKDFDALVKLHGLSRSEAAKKLRVDRRTVIRWATGESAISRGQAMYIRSILGKRKPAK